MKYAGLGLVLLGVIWIIQRIRRYEEIPQERERNRRWIELERERRNRAFEELS